MKRKTYTYDIIIYTVLVFALSGLLVLLQSVFVNSGNYWLVFPQFAPTLTLLILLMIRRQAKTAFDIRRCVDLNKKVLTYCLFSALFVVLVFGGFAFVLSSFAMPLLQWETSTPIINFLCLLLGCLGEEIGWRGFLLPAFHHKFPLITSALLTGVIWGAWHLDFGNGVAGFLVTVLFITALSVIMSWVQVKSGGSIIPPTTLHFFVNFFARSTMFDLSLSEHFMLAMLLALLDVILFFWDRKTFLATADGAQKANVPR